jgi:hypothetical protein
MVKEDREMVVRTTPYVIASLPTDFNFAQESIAGVAPDSYRDRRWFFPAPSEILGFSLGNGCPGLLRRPVVPESFRDCHPIRHQT